MLPAAKFTHFKNYLSVYALLICGLVALLASTANATASGAELLQATEAAKVVPTTVFFRGQVATVQARNSGGVKLGNGMFILCALVDTSGYSTAVQQKYQAYLITEVTLEINGQSLKPGAYGVGFIEGDRFVVMDLGGHDLFTTSSQHDATLKRPTPLQVLANATANGYRLYINRNYVIFAPGQ